MDGRWLGLTLCVTASLFAGCKTSHKLAHHGACDSTACEVQEECPTDGYAHSCAKKPQEVHVHVPRQKVIVNRNGNCTPECGPTTQGQPSGTAQARAAGLRTRTIEEQQIVQTRQVMLVPQQVLVPFVQTTTSGPIRVNGMSETQVMNMTGIAETTTTGLRMDRLTGTVGMQNTTASAPASNPQSVADCAAQLRQYEDRIIKLVAVTESLDKELRELKQHRPAATPEPMRVPMPPKNAYGFPGDAIP